MIVHDERTNGRIRARIKFDANFRRWFVKVGCYEYTLMTYVDFADLQADLNNGTLTHQLEKIFVVTWAPSRKFPIHRYYPLPIMVKPENH